MARYIADPLLPGLTALLDPAFVQAQIGDPQVVGCDLGYVRHDPGIKCKVSYSVRRNKGDAAEGKELFGYGVAFRSEDFAKAWEEVKAAQWINSSFGPGMKAIPEHCILLFEFPNDRSLEALKLVTKNESNFLDQHLPREWSTNGSDWSSQIVRYKPESRAVLRCNKHNEQERNAGNGVHGVFVRITAGKGATEYQKLVQLTSRLTGREKFRVPKPLALACNGDVAIYGVVPGTKLRLWLSSGDGDAALERTANALAELHHLRVKDLAVRKVAKYLSEATAALDTVARYAPEFERSVLTVKGVLEKCAPPDDECRIGYLHGDLHHGQVLVNEDKAGFLDFERAHAGPPEVDLGNLAAHFIYKYSAYPTFMENFLGHYERAAGIRLDYRRLRWWTIIGLAQILVKPIRRLDEDAHEKLRKLLDQTQTEAAKL